MQIRLTLKILLNWYLFKQKKTLYTYNDQFWSISISKMDNKFKAAKKLLDKSSILKSIFMVFSHWYLTVV